MMIQIIVLIFFVIKNFPIFLTMSAEIAQSVGQVQIGTPYGNLLISEDKTLDLRLPKLVPKCLTGEVLMDKRNDEACLVP